MTVSRGVPTIGLKPDWIVVALPIAVTVQVLAPKASLFLIAFLAVAAYLRKPDSRFHVQVGPLLVLFAACAIVFSRPENYFLPAAVILVCALVLRLVMTVDARKIIASLMDGWGLYLLANVLGDLAGIQPPAANQHITYATESTGFVRTIFPLTGGLNSPTIVAGAYFAAAIFLLREPGWFRRSFRLICSAAAIFVLVSVSSRTALAVTVGVSIAAIVIPFVSRGIAQVAALITAVSALEFPTVYNSIDFAIKPLTNALAPGRDTTDYGIISLQGREQIWDSSIKFWNQRINDFQGILFGFGEGGQYRSGASSTYSYLLRGSTAHPELATVHNAFLQQLFDGGVIGWLLLVLATYWASARLSKRRSAWGHWALAAIFAMTVLLLGSVTEAIMAPGVHTESFWLLVVLTGVACQARGIQSDEISLESPSREHVKDDSAVILDQGATRGTSDKSSPTMGGTSET